MKKKVIAAGHICLDITPAFCGNKISRMEELLKPGKLVNVAQADVHVGGSVANTGLALKILGTEVSLIAKVGEDIFGQMVQSALKEYNAAEQLLMEEGGATSYSVILAMPGIDRIFLHNPGMNDTFCSEDISEDMLNDTALFHFGYPPLMKNMYLNQGKELEKLFQKVKQAGVAISMDMASVDPDGPAGAENWEKILERVIPYTDFFEPSAEELCYMLDQDLFRKWQERANGGDITEVLDVEQDIRPLADRCMKLGAKVLVIKCGAKGMYYRTASKKVLSRISERTELNEEQWENREGFEKSYVPERVLSGTGAGDTSIAAFLAAMLKGYGCEDCMHLAAATGASCVSAYDALSGLRSFEELTEKINTGWKKYD